MSYGALLTDQNGVPFYIDGTRPLTLINKITYSAPNGLASTDLYPNDGVMRFTFLQDNASFSTNGCSWLQLDTATNMWRLYTSLLAGTIVTIFIFGYANQPLPASGWGIAIWDGAGNCILTNESKVLRDIQALGDQNNDTTSGFRFSTTLNGSWAVAPFWSGIFTAVNNSTGQPRPVRADFYTVAQFNGGQTFIKSGWSGTIDGSASNPSYSNSRSLITVVNVSGY